MRQLWDLSHIQPETRIVLEGANLVYPLAIAAAAVVVGVVARSRRRYVTAGTESANAADATVPAAAGSAAPTPEK